MLVAAGNGMASQEHAWLPSGVSSVHTEYGGLAWARVQGLPLFSAPPTERVASALERAFGFCVCGGGDDNGGVIGVRDDGGVAR